MTRSSNYITRAVAVLSFLVAAHMPQAAQSYQTVLVDECADLATLNQALQAGGGVIARMSSEVACADEDATESTTVEVPESSLLYVKLAADTTGSVLTFVNVRFVVASRDSGGAALTFIPDVEFRTTFDDQDVNGGALQVLSGAIVHFLGTSGCYRVHISSDVVEGDGDYADHDDFGGCWFNEGTIEAAGLATFYDCDNSGGGEPPGDGGAVFNGVSGTIDFLGGINATENSCSDDFDGKGGAIYNAGYIVVNADSYLARNFANGDLTTVVEVAIDHYGFEDVADEADAPIMQYFLVPCVGRRGIFNEEGGTFLFADGVTVEFYDNDHRDDVCYGGHVDNRGSLVFTGYVTFIKGEGLVTSGHMEFQAGALFQEQKHGALNALAGATFGEDGAFGSLSDLVFIDNTDARCRGCDDITYFTENYEEATCGP